MGYKIEFYAYPPNIQIIFFPFQIKVGSKKKNPAHPDPDPRKKVSDPHPRFKVKAKAVNMWKYVVITNVYVSVQSWIVEL